MIAVDPGNSTGIAVFANDHLTHVWHVSDMGEAEIMAPLEGERVIIERPTIYPKMRVPPNDILTLAIRVGRYQEWYESQGARVTLVEPRTWKGQVPKPIHHKRILAKLFTNELRALGEYRTQIDVLDAVGLGLWALKRLV
jgi:hypothetical protein